MALASVVAVLGVLGLGVAIGLVLGVLLTKLVARRPASPPSCASLEPLDEEHRAWTVVPTAERIYEVRRTHGGGRVAEISGWRETQRVVARLSRDLPGGVYCRRVF